MNVEIGASGNTAAVLFGTGSATLAIPTKKVEGEACQVCSLYNARLCQSPQCDPEASTSSQDCVFGYYDLTQSSTASFISSSNPECGTSSFSANGHCPVAITYGTGDGPVSCNEGFEGDLVRDTISIGGATAEVVLVSITTIQSGFQVAPTSCIMGVELSYDNTLKDTVLA